MFRKIKPSDVGFSWIDDAGNLCTYRENGTIHVQTVNNEPTMTIQSERESCDINKIVAQHLRTGIMTNVRTSPLEYGDFNGTDDYATAQMRIQEADEAFMSLPAELRFRFKNDPAQLIEFLNDENNRAEAIELGLVAPPQDSQIPQGDVTNQPSGVSPEGG